LLFADAKTPLVKIAQVPVKKRDATPEVSKSWQAHIKYTHTAISFLFVCAGDAISRGPSEAGEGTRWIRQGSMQHVRMFAL